MGKASFKTKRVMVIGGAVSVCTRVVYGRVASLSLLRILWREQHPEGHEQTALNFRESKPVAQAVALFEMKVDKAKV